MLSRRQLIMYGVTNTLGAGIFAVMGIAVKYTGSALFLAFGAAGVMCLLVAYIYAEMCARMPVNGSAFVYVYVILGQLAAWTVGWYLLPMYAATAALLARSLATFIARFLSLYLSLEIAPWLYKVTLFGVEDCCPLSMFISLVIGYLNTRKTES